MKKTVTTILSLAMALILVSSLSSGVIYANGRHRDREVVVMDCEVPGPTSETKPTVSSIDSFPMLDELVDAEGKSCSAIIALLLNMKYKIENVVGVGTFNFTSRYTFVKK